MVRAYYHDDPIIEEAPRRSFAWIKLLAIAGVASLFLHTTLAANVRINSGSPAEFGQGIQVTSACSGNTSLTLVPANTFANVSGGGAYKLASITASNIPSSCYGLDFRLQVYDSTTANSPLALFNSTSTSPIIYDNSGTFSKGTGVGYTVTTLSTSSFRIDFTNPVAYSTSADRFTIESMNHALYYSYGDTGPAGGIIVITPTSEGGYGGSYYYEMAAADMVSTAALCNTDPFQMRGYNNQDRAVSEGPTNTTNLLGICSSGAANTAVTYTSNGKSDWFLPSFQEMFAMCRYARQLAMADPAALSCSGGTLRAGFTDGYWTSTTGGTHSYAMAFSMNNGTGNYTPSNSTMAIRTLRRFTS